MNFKDLKSKILENDEVKSEYEKLEPEYQLIRALIEARESQGLTQEQLAEACGINRADISRFENGNGNPSLKTLKKLASGLGKHLEIRFA